MLQNTRGPDGNGGEGGKKGTLLVKENRPGVCDGVNGGRGVPPPSAEPSQWRPLSKESSGELPSQSPSHGSQWQGAAALNSTVFVPHTRSTLRGGGGSHGGGFWANRHVVQKGETLAPIPN